jgi:hypothetical protein
MRELTFVLLMIQHPEHELFGDNQKDTYMLFPNGKEFELWFYALQRAAALSTNVRLKHVHTRVRTYDRSPDLIHDSFDL